MGNRCCRPESSSVVWAGDGWEAQSSETDKGSSIASSSSSRSIRSSSSAQQHRQVKVVMTRKELEELLRKADLHGEVLARDVTDWLMMDSSGRNSINRQHPSWRPALTSIPEIN